MNPQSHLFRWQAITFITLWVGYAGYYVCRSNLSVAGPLLQKELADQPTSAAEEWLRDARDGVSRRISSVVARGRALVGLESIAPDIAVEAKRDESSGKRRFGLIASISIL